MTYDRSAHLKKPAHVRLYRFEVFQLGREERLGPLDRWLLTTLAMLCDYKTGDYFGTITELAEDTGASRRAVGDAVVRLESADLIQVVEDFGPKVRGHLRVLALSRVVLDAPEVIRAEQRDTTEPHVRPFRRRSRAPTALQSRPNRDLTATSDANEHALTCTDADAQGSQRRREQGDNRSRDAREAVALLKREFNAEEVAS